MSRHSHVRCWLLAAFISAVALAEYDAQPRRQQPVTLQPASLTVGSSTRARPFVRLASAAQPRELDPFVLSQPLRDSIVALALAQIGTPYVRGGTTPRRGFDCSGLVRYVVAQVHMTVPRTANMQARVGTPIERNELEPGDLIAFGQDGLDTVSHIGIYVGQGKFVHASSVARRVVVSALDRKPSRLIRPMRGARRLLATADPFAHAGG